MTAVLETGTAARPLGRLWLVVNSGSGSTDAAGIAAARSALVAHGGEIVRTSTFPDDAPPAANALSAAGIDTLAIIAGDGTINAVVTAAGNWPGQCLVLPGGTMNMLAKALHGDAEREAVIAGLARATLVTLPIACAAGHEAMVGVILGPAAAWVDPREDVRKGRLLNAVGAARRAWARTFGHGVALDGQGPHHRAIIVHPLDGGLEVVTVAASGMADVVRLGWNWLTGNWRAAPGVTVRSAKAATISGRRQVRALFDGEPARLASPVKLTCGRTRLHFMATR